MGEHKKTTYDIPVESESAESLVETTRETERLAGGQILEETRPGFLELAVDAYAYAEELIDQAAKRYYPPLACSQGCSYCCHLPVSVSVAEVVAVLDYVQENFSADEREALRQRVAQRYQEVVELSDQERKHTNIRCPLLDEAGRCSVYPVRPLACRGFNSTDLEACRQRFEHPELDLSNPAFGYNVQAALGVAQGVQQALQDAGLEPIELDLIRALRLFWSDPQRVLKKWRKRGRRAIKAAQRSDL
ncbi:MAG: YkgJ family cysteine cluster protein [Vulcanimicrobiota bacterium]